MQVKTGIQLHTFASGPDGGVDLTDDSHSHNIVVQVKHYERSSFSALKRNLEKEVEKVRRLAPKQYYICVSQQLTDENVNTIYEMFSDYMESTNNIVTLDDIDSFLHDPQNKEITGQYTNLYVESKTTVDLIKELIAKEESPEESLIKKLKDRLESVKNAHPSFRLMNEAGGLDRNLFPKGSLQIRSGSRQAELDAEGDNTEDLMPKEASLAEYVKETWKPGKRRHITIEGEGGIGKTVALLSLATEGGVFPEDVSAIYVPLHELNQGSGGEKAAGDRTNLLDAYIESYLHNRKACACTKEEISVFYDRCRNGCDDHPQTVLLLDGYNEVLDTLKREVSRAINEWACMQGVQIITTSRTSWSCGDDFLKIRLRPINEADIRGYLERVGVDMPAPGDNIWKVINYPLMLTLYAHIEAVQKRVMGGLSTGVLARENLDWHPMNKAGDIIWNYLQKELARCAEEMGGNQDHTIEDYAVAILHTAPYVAWRMSRKDAFSLPLAEKDKVVNEDDMSFSSLVRESLFCLRDPADWPDQLEQIVDGDGITESKTERWINLAGQMDSKESLEKTERIAKILLNEVNLFRIQESTGKDKSISRKKNKKRVQMMHQQFRDGLAGIWLCQRVETMEEPASLKNGVFKTTGDKYALPLCWRERIGRYVLKFAAEIMDEDNAERFWEAGRVYQPSDVKFAYTMLNLMSEISMKDGIHQNDFSGLDFSGMDLRDICLFLYRAEGSMRLKLPTWEDQGKLVKTGISARSFMPPGHSDRVQSVAVTENGKRAVSGGSDGTVHVWNLETMTCEKILCGHKGTVSSTAVTRDGKRAVSGGFDGTVRVWDLETMTCEKVKKVYGDIVQSVAVTEDGKRVVSLGLDQGVRIWDLEKGTCKKVLEGYREDAQIVYITSDGKRAVSVGLGDDWKVRIWNLEKEKCEKILKMKSVWIRSLVVTGDGKWAVIVEDFCVRIWDLEKETCMEVLGGYYDIGTRAVVTGDGKSVVIKRDDGVVLVWNLKSMRCEKVLDSHCDNDTTIAVTDDGKRAVTGGEDGSVRIWDLEKMRCEKELEGHGRGINSVVVTDDGKKAVSGEDDGSVRIWSLEKETCKKVLEGHRLPVYSIAMTGDEKRAISCGEDGNVRIWNLETERCEKVLEDAFYSLSNVAVTADGKRAVNGEADGCIRIWDLESGETCKKIRKGNRLNLYSVAMTADGKRIVGGELGGSVWIWDLEREKCEKVMEGLSDQNNSVAVTTDGKRVVSGGQDGFLRIWDLKGEIYEKVLESQTDAIRSISVTGDGKRAVISGFDGCMRIWDLEKKTCEKVFYSLSGIDITQINLSEAVIDTEEDKEILRQNGALV